MNRDKVWKDVIGYEAYFKVSDHGDIWSKRTNKLLKLTISKQGYPTFSTRIGGRYGECYCFKVHRLVAEAFLSPPKDYQIKSANNTHYKKVPVNHKDCDKTNNHISNLEWCTHSENTQHAIDSGMADYSERCKLSRSLSNEDVIFIRTNYKPYHKKFGQRALARRFDVHKSIIQKIVNLETYKEVT